jgi:chloramphenicol O-acetyltransferase type A
MFTLGKYYPQDGKVLLPVAIQIHHAVCDGFHVARLFNELQAMCDDLANQ